MESYSEVFSLGGKTVVVTGGAGLLGKEMARGLGDFGATVVVADVNLEAVRQIANSIGRKAKAEQLNVTSEDSIKELIKKYERIDVWINSAYPRTSDWGHKLEQVKIESWRHNVDMQLNSCFFCCRQVADKMKVQKSGSIINFGSIYGIVGPYFPIYEGTDMTTPAAYAAIKGGIINLTRYLATYLAPYNVRVNCISPGGVFDHQPETFVQAYNKRTPLGRMAAPGEIVGTAIYLASEASSYVTGQNLLVDGGWTAW